MVSIDYEPSEVLISLREPYNKKTVWIHPKPDNIEVKISTILDLTFEASRPAYSYAC